MDVWDKVVGRGYMIAPDKKLYPGTTETFFLNWSSGRTEDFTTISDQFPGMVATNDILGGINIAANFSSMWGPTVDPEWLIQQKIDIII